MSIEIKHAFSVENDSSKRDFILNAHGNGSDSTSDHGFHLFDDVKVLASDANEEVYCHSCGSKHTVPESVDVLIAGPSCKNLSKMFANRTDFVNCFSALYSTDAFAFFGGMVR